jgi:hypothetical protein
LSIHTHLCEDDHTDAMAALGAMGIQAASADVIPMWRSANVPEH